MQQKIYILIGLPGSGKTTYARDIVSRSPERTVRISMDDILQMISFYKFVRENAPLYHDFEDTLYIKALAEGFDVVVDRTNIDRATREKFIKPAKIARDIARDILKKWDEERMSLFRESDEKIVAKIFNSMEFERHSLESRIKDAFQDVYNKSFTQSLYGESPNFHKILKRVSNLKITGVYFNIPISTCIKRRTENPEVERRGEGIDWEEVILRMVKRYQEPMVEEGFDELIKIEE